MKTHKKQNGCTSKKTVKILVKPYQKTLVSQSEISIQQDSGNLCQKQQFENVSRNKNMYNPKIPSIAVIDGSHYSQRKNSPLQFSRPALFCYEELTQSTFENLPLGLTTFKTGQMLSQIMNQKFDQYETKMDEIIQAKFGSINRFLTQHTLSMSNDITEQVKIQQRAHRCEQLKKYYQTIYFPLKQDDCHQFFIVRKQTGNFIKTYSFEIFEPHTMNNIFNVKFYQNKYNIFLQSNPQRKIAHLQSNFFKTQFILKSFHEQSRTQTKEASIVYDFSPNPFNNCNKIQMQVYRHKENKQFISTQHYCTKQPRWNSQIQKYIIDFPNKKVTFSKRNFILMKKNCKNKVPIVSFCKFRYNLYHIQINQPFSILQGIGLAVSNLDKMI